MEERGLAGRTGAASRFAEKEKLVIGYQSFSTARVPFI
jgi:hypothetical protein